MTQSLRCRPVLEALEDRWVPAVSARVVAGDVLLITGRSDSGSVNVVQTASGSFTVSDGATPVFTSSPGSVEDILIQLRSRSHNVLVNLGGFTLNGSLNANLGFFGTNSLSVTNGTIADNLVFTGGLGRDTLNLGAGVSVNNNLLVNTGFGNDVVTLGAGSTVGDRAVFNLGFGNDRLDLNGTVGDGSGLNLLVNAEFGRGVVNFNAGATLNGEGRILLGFGNDQLNLSDLAVINGSLFANGGFGQDDFNGLLPRANVTVRSFES
jgi:hypothetical protein